MTTPTDAELLAEARATIARLNTTLQAYGDGGNEGPSIWGFLDEDPDLLRLLKTKDERVAYLEAVLSELRAEGWSAVLDKIMRRVRRRKVKPCQK